MNPDHDGSGRFMRTIEGAERDAKAAHLRARRFTYQEIADQLGYETANGAYLAVKRAIDNAPKEATAEVIASELEQLDILAKRAQMIMESKTKAISQGKILDQQDYNISMQAMDRLLKIQERRARLLGLDSATKVQSDVTVNYTVTGIDPEDLK